MKELQDEFVQTIKKLQDELEITTSDAEQQSTFFFVFTIFFEIFYKSIEGSISILRIILFPGKVSDFLNNV